MEDSVIAIQSFVITTIVYALLVPVVFEMENNAFVEEKNFVDVSNDDTTFSQQVVETKDCKSPCPSNSEMCIAMCA